MTTRSALSAAVALTTTAIVMLVGGCGWRGANALPLPGTAGHGPGSYQIRAEFRDVSNLQPNSRVRVDDVNVGTVSKIERQGWHAVVTITLDGNVVLPANATATIGQTSLLGSLHVELAAPREVAPEGRLRDGSVIALSSSGAYPSTEQTLSVASMLLNGGGLGQVQDITRAFSTAFGGRQNDFRDLIGQLDEFIGHLDQQKSDIVTATESINHMAAQFADQKPVLDRALRTIPDALSVLREQRNNLATAFDQFGRFNALAADSARQTKDALVKEFNDLGPVFDSLANAGPALTRSLSLISTYPWPKENVAKFFRGDAANITMILDMTLSRLDSSFFTGTRWEGNLTELEMQWGRTIGQLPSPVTAGNPLVAPYHLDQGP